MKRLVDTVVAGVYGAVEGLFTFGVALVLAASLGLGLTSLMNRGMIDLDAFIPRSVASESQAGGLQVEGTPEQRAAVREAFDDLVWPVDTSGFSVVVTDASNLPSYVAGTYTFPDNVITLSDDVVDASVRQPLSQVLAHEVGHMFDCVYLDAQGRAEFMAMRGFPLDTDWQSEKSQWADRPCEDFAEVYAAFASPSSGVPIATNIGKSRNPQKEKELIERYQPGPARRSSMRADAALSFARETVASMQTDPLVVEGLIVAAVLWTTLGASRAICAIPYRARARRTR